MQILSKALFLIVSAVNLAPVGGVLSVDYMERLYGVALDDPNLVILMRHRAVLFGIVGSLLVVAAFRPSARPLGVAVGMISMLSFVLVVFLVGDYNAKLQNAAIIDLAASVLLVGAGFATRCERKREAKT